MGESLTVKPSGKLSLDVRWAYLFFLSSLPFSLRGLPSGSPFFLPFPPTFLGILPSLFFLPFPSLPTFFILSFLPFGRSLGLPIFSFFLTSPFFGRSLGVTFIDQCGVTWVVWFTRFRFESCVIGCNRHRANATPDDDWRSLV